VQPDIIIPDPGSTIDFDRYGFVRNNPLKYVDPDGHNPILIIIALVGAAIFFSQIPSDQYQPDPANRGDPRVQLFGLSLMVEPAIAPAACFNDGDCTNEAQAVGQAAQNDLNIIKNGAGQGYNSFSAFKYANGPAGSGTVWHHIVEQNPTNLSNFGSQVINNTSNLIRLPSGTGLLHQRISGYYSSIQPLVTGSDTLTIRQWLQTKSFEFQWKFGIELIKRFGGAKYIIDQFGDKGK